MAHRLRDIAAHAATWVLRWSNPAGQTFITATPLPAEDAQWGNAIRAMGSRLGPVWRER